MKIKTIIIISICFILIASITFGSIILYKSTKNKKYDKVFNNINKIYESNKKITEKDKYVNSLYQFHIKNNELKKELEQYSFENFITNNNLEKLYVENNNILENLKENKKNLENIKNEILTSFTYKKMVNLVTKDKKYITKRINKSIFDKNKKTIEKIYSDNINSYNNLSEFIDYLNINKTKWENNNNTIIIDGDEYKKYIEGKNKEFNINILTKMKLIPKNKSIPIFMYHAVNDKTWGITSLFQKIKDFENEMKYLSDNGYKTIFLSDIKNYLDEKKVVVLTFDDAYEDFYRIAYPIMKKYNIKSNLFVISGASGDKYVTTEQIKKLSNSGLVEIGSHTLSHPNLTTLNSEDLNNELKNSKEVLEKLINKEVNTFAYPVGYHNDNVVKATGKYYKYALLMGGGVNIINDNTNYLRLKRVSMYRGAPLDYFVKNVKTSN